MATIHYESDADLELLRGRKVAVIGYGSQGHAHALNLHDSGVDVRVGLREGSSSWAAAEADGLQVRETVAAAAEADVVVMLAPDTSQPQIWAQGLAEQLTDGKALVVAHGFCVHYGFITPPEGVDVFMIAPKSPGHLVRRLFVDGQGVPGLIAVHQDATGTAEQLALAYGAGIGCARAGLLETTFAEETETDLFGEQTILCGGVSELIKAGFETLTEAGYQPEVAYFECLHELKLIVDLFYDGGLTGMNWSVSDTAEYGGYTRGPRVVGEQTKQAMREVLGEVRDGSFAQEWMDEWNGGAARFTDLRQQMHDHQIERVGRELRAMMPWIDDPTAGQE